MELSEKEEIEYLIEQSNSLIFDQIERIRGKFSRRINEFILVEAKKNPKTQDDLEYILDNGFRYNNIDYIRFGKSASQGKDGITAFVCEEIYDELYIATQMDIEIDECVISKYEAYRCLLFSSCTLVEDYIPNIVIIDEYEKVLKDQWIRYVVEKEKEFTNEKGELKKYKSREIEEGYHDIKLSPFDGCGCHEKEFAETTSNSLGLDYMAIGNQVRMPFIKGYSIYVPFREIFSTMGITEIVDIYGRTHNIEDIDCIWNISMFKGHKVFKKKYGDMAWEKYIETFKKYKFKIGISKYSHHVKDINLNSRMNFQYLQCLDLWNPKYIESFAKKPPEKYDILDENNYGKIINIAKYTTNLFDKIIKGERFYTYKFLGINDTDNYKAESKYVEAVLANDVMLKDPCIKRFIYRKLKKSINEAKLGKIYVEGFYHTVVGDMIGYLEYASGKEPKGCIKSKEFFTDTLPKGKVLSFRSPLVCPSEVNDVTLVENDVTRKWFSYFKNQDVAMINMYDLSAPQQGGMDEDGDAVLLCSNKTIIDSKIHKPIIIDIEDKATAKSKLYSKENITEYELNSRDNRIGEITNVATSIENKYTTNEEVSSVYADFASLLRVMQGKEIDFLKTGLRWQMNKGLRKHLKQLPWFLLFNYPNKLKTYEKLRKINKNVEDVKDKIKLNAYRSPSPMNELCEYICSWEKHNILWDNSVVDTSCLILNNSIDLNDKKILKKIRHLINEYSVKFKELIQKQNGSSTEDYFQSDVLLETYKNKLLEIVSNEELLANYVIKVSYSNLSISKSLAWSGYGDYIIKNLRQNSPRNKFVSITEFPYNTDDTYEFLGKYYIFKECDTNL